MVIHIEMRTEFGVHNCVGDVNDKNVGKFMRKKDGTLVKIRNGVLYGTVRDEMKCITLIRVGFYTKSKEYERLQQLALSR